MNIPGIFEIFPFAHGPEYLLGDDFRESDYRVQRRAQFVAHDGEKIGFRQTRALGQFLGVPQFFLGHFFLCHVLRQNVKAKDGTVFRYARREGSLYLALQTARGIEADQIILPLAG